MKKFLLSISLTLVTATSFGQFWWGINFDSPWDMNRIIRDTTSNPNCIWQVGHPNKTVFASAFSVPNAIVTDSLNPVPANDTSTFYLIHQRDNSAPFHIFGLQFWFRLNGDSTDYGTIEISPDSGVTWINLLTQDTTYQLHWVSTKPTLMGSTSGWQHFYVVMDYWASGGSTFPVAMTADTILFRFTYISDSSSIPHDGWIIDDFQIEDWYEGIAEVQNDNLISISPNPTSDHLVIQRTKSANIEQVQIMNYSGQILIDIVHLTGESVDVSALPSGIYFLRYSDDKNYSTKKFIVQR